MLYLSESLNESEAAAPEPDQAAVTAEPAAEPAAQQPPKAKKDRLALLKKLGLDPPPVVKLCGDEGAFIQLEPPKLNPGR